MTTPPNTLPSFIPFDLEKFKAGKPIVCRNGFVPTDIHYFEDAYNNHTPIFFGTNEGTVMRCDINGICPSDLANNSDNKYDLFHPCEQKEGWVAKKVINEFVENYVIQKTDPQYEDIKHDLKLYSKITWHE